MAPKTRKIKQKEVAEIRKCVMIAQKGICPMCERELEGNLPSLDHDHTSGRVRGVLCRNCNQIEGRVASWARRGKKQLTELQFLRNLVDYLEYHKANPSPLIHHTHGRVRRRRRKK